MDIRSSGATMVLERPPAMPPARSCFIGRERSNWREARRGFLVSEEVVAGVVICIELTVLIPLLLLLCLLEVEAW